MRPKEVCEIIETVPNEVYGVSTDDKTTPSKVYGLLDGIKITC